jgi:hypothetical protein
MSAEFEVQKALYSALDGIGLRVYDSAPQQADGASLAVFPYVEIGAIALAPMDTKERDGFDFVARIHTRSRSGAMREAKDIQGAIYARLHHGSLSIVGLRLILLRRETSTVSRAADGSFHGICEYRGLTETTAFLGVLQ